MKHRFKFSTVQKNCIHISIRNISHCRTKTIHVNLTLSIETASYSMERHELHY